MGRLSVVVLCTSEIARQQEYYEQSLGLTAAVSSPGWVQYATRDAALALRALPAGGTPHLELGFDVKSLDDRLAALAAHGVEPMAPIEQTPEYRLARIADPDGNVLQLIERAKPLTTGTWPRLSHAIVNAHAFEACATFYADVLDLRVGEEREHLITFESGEVTLVLHASRDADDLPLPPDQRVSFALMDDDLDAWADELREKGLRFATIPTDDEHGRMAEVEDADGWFVVLRGPDTEIPLEEELAEEFVDEDDTRIEHIRRSGSLEGQRPGFAGRPARKKVERVSNKGFEAVQRSPDADRGGFVSTPRPFAPRPFTPRPDGAPRPTGPGGPPRPFTPRPEGSRPFTPRPAGSGPSRPFTPRPDGPRPPRRDGFSGPGGPRPGGPRPGGPPRPPRREG